MCGFPGRRDVADVRETSVRLSAAGDGCRDDSGVRTKVNVPTDEAAERSVQGLNEEIRDAVRAFSGKWKLEILWLLNGRVHRFNEIRRSLGGVTQHVLTHQLRELEKDGMLTRIEYPEIPPRVEYTITEKARRLQPVFREIFHWARQDMEGHRDDSC